MVFIFLEVCWQMASCLEQLRNVPSYPHSFSHTYTSALVALADNMPASSSSNNNELSFTFNELLTTELFVEDELFNNELLEEDELFNNELFVDELFNNELLDEELFNNELLEEEELFTTELLEEDELFNTELFDLEVFDLEVFEYLCRFFSLRYSVISSFVLTHVCSMFCLCP